MSWDGRQTAMLEAMGLGNWPTCQPAERAARAEGPAPALPAAATEATANSVRREWSDLDGLHAQVRNCRSCRLCEGRRQAVPGIGHPQAHWLVVGEAPGEQEDVQGEPFVGASGQLLDAMLVAVGRTRHPGAPEQQVFIANALKCRPPGNRNPSAEELQACRPYLLGQVALIKPRLVLALGRFAAQALLGRDEAIGRLRGGAHALADGTPVVVSYHPSYLLRQPLEKARAWEDLCLAVAVYEKAMIAA